MPERILWNMLRAGRLGEFKFRRQQPIGPYVVDFFCERAGLVVELDGASHLDRPQFAADRVGDAYLGSRGLRVLRVSNDEVLKNRSRVAETIHVAAEDCSRERQTSSGAPGRKPSP